MNLYHFKTRYLIWRHTKEWFDLGKRQTAVKAATAGLIGAAGLMVAGGLSASAKTITVKSGDSMWGIANKYGVTIKTLEQLNHIKQTKAGVDQIFAGQKIVLPGRTTAPLGTKSAKAKAAGTTKQVVRSVKATTATTRTTGTTYTVRSGDSLSRISSKYGVTINQLKSWNGLKSNFIYPGEKLAVRASAAQKSGSVVKPLKQSVSKKKATTTKADAVIANSTTSVTGLAVKLAGMKIPYVWGGASLNGMDCSGLVSYVYGHAAGISLAHSTVSQEKAVSTHSVADAQPGDILFWGQEGATYHDAIYIGNNQYVAAPQPGQNVEIETISQYFMPSFAGTVTDA